MYEFGGQNTNYEIGDYVEMDFSRMKTTPEMRLRKYAKIVDKKRGMFYCKFLTGEIFTKNSSNFRRKISKEKWDQLELDTATDKYNL